jgi:hypothetical protein
MHEAAVVRRKKQDSLRDLLRLTGSSAQPVRIDQLRYVWPLRRETAVGVRDSPV